MAHRITPSIVCSDFQTYSISKEGNVFAFGCSSFTTYEIEDHEEDIVSPRMIPNMHNITSIAVGPRHAIYLDSDGNVYGFGSNLSGQIGVDKILGNIKTSMSHTIRTAAYLFL